jgi:GNAT superfamily N-acetyltransferase
MIITGEDVLSGTVEQRTADLAHITELVRLLRPDCPPLDLGRLAAVNESGRALFYRLDGRIVGCAQLVVYAGLATYMPTLESVVTDPLFRGRGIARKLVSELIEFAKSRKCWRVALLTEPENKEARALYQGLGFAEIMLVRGRLPL